MSLSLVQLPPEGWPALAELISRCNRRPDGGIHCLHADCGPDLASHAAKLATLTAVDATFWALTEGDATVGMVGCEWDATLGRAWLWGPLATDAALLAPFVPVIGPALASALPLISQFNGFPAADGPVLNAWYAEAGYQPQQLHRVLRAEIALMPAGSSRVRPATAADLPAALALHLALFPSPYIGEAGFERAVAQADRELFVAVADDGTPIAYLHVQDDPSEPEAYVDYLGVAPAHRGQGLGRDLLAAAARWGADKGRAHLSLTVREDREGALSLYAHAGFVEISAGRHWQKVLERSAG